MTGDASLGDDRDPTRSEDITWSRVLAPYHPWAVDSHEVERLFREILERLEALEAKAAE